MGNLDSCVKKFGKALSPNDVTTIRDLGGDAAAVQTFMDQLIVERDGYFPPEVVSLAQQAQRDERGMYSMVEQAALDMNLPEWKAKKRPNGNTIYTSDMVSRRAKLAEMLKDVSDTTTPEWQELNELDKKRRIQEHVNSQQPTAKGSVIWEKIKGMPDVKEEELKYLGLEEWLTEAEGGVSRQEVVDFIQANGIKVEETMATERSEDDDYDYEEIEWDDGYADTDSENWYHIVSNELYEYDRNPEEVSSWFSFEDWVKENVDNNIFADLLDESESREVIEQKGEQEFRLDVVEGEDGKFTIDSRWISDNQPIQNQSATPLETREQAETRAKEVMERHHNADGVPMFNRTDQTTVTGPNPEYDAGLKTLVDAEDWEGVVAYVGLDVIAPAARDDYEKQAEKTAEEDYMQDPYKTYSAANCFSTSINRCIDSCRNVDRSDAAPNLMIRSLSIN